MDGWKMYIFGFRPSGRCELLVSGSVHWNPETNKQQFCGQNNETLRDELHSFWDLKGLFLVGG